MITLIYYYRANRKIKQKSETPDNPKMEGFNYVHGSWA